MPDKKPVIRWVAIVAVVLSTVSISGGLISHEMAQARGIIEAKAEAQAAKDASTQEGRRYESVLKETNRRLNALQKANDKQDAMIMEIQRDIKSILRAM